LLTDSADKARRADRSSARTQQRWLTIKIRHIVRPHAAKYYGANLTWEDSAVVPSYVFAGVGGYYASNRIENVFREKIK